jgi:membrane protease YdiL (CAAX protease family)
MRNSTVLGANDEYVQQAASYGRMDALLALILYAVIFFQFVFLGKIFIHKGSTLTGIYTFCATGIVSSICIGLVFLFCSFRKQKLETVGFSKSQAKKSFSLGMLLFLLVVIYRCFGFGPGKIAQTDIGSMIIKVVYYLVLIGFTEEILIRGYIGTRMFGYFKNKLLSIIIVGIMWSLYHIPFQMIVRQMSLIEYISANWWNLLGIFILHFIFQWSYAKHNSIIAPTILHFIWNFV